MKQIIQKDLIDINPNNRVKVELFDARTGKKIKEQEGRNIVLNRGKDRIFLRNIWEDLIQNSGGSSQWRNVRVLVLTDASDPVNAENSWLKGNMIGWANRTLGSASGDKQGLLNKIETHFGPDKELVYVFDWATSAGNGTFQTLWWMFTYDESTPFLNYSSGALSITGPSGLYNICYDDKGSMYQGRFAATIYYYERTPEDSSLFTYKAYTSIDLSHISATGRFVNIDWDGTYFWLFNSDNDTYYKVNTSWVVQDSWTMPAGITGTVFNGNFACHDGFIYIWDSHKKLYKITTAGAIDHTYDFSGEASAPNNDKGVCSDGGDLYIMGSQSNAAHSGVIVDLSGAGSLVGNGTFAVHTNNEANLSRFDPVTGTYVGRRHGWMYHGYPQFRPWSQVVLESPVTKADTQTMKITYTFDINAPDARL